MQRVVVVEGHALVAKYFRYLLEQRGYSVVVTEVGDDVLELARDAVTVAVIIDALQRPTQLGGEYVDGLRLCRRIKDDERTRRVGVIVAAAHVKPDERERALRESGADAFVRTPLADPGELAQLIEGFAARHAADLGPG